jgi:uncharacterized protein YkwD
MGTDPKRVALAIVLMGLVAFAGYRAWTAQQQLPAAYVTMTPESVSTTASVSLTPVVSSTPARSPLFTKPTKTPTPQPTTIVSDAAAILGEINRERAVQGRSALTPQATLQDVAQAHAIDMVSQGFFDHTSPDGITFADRIRASGYPVGVSGENIGLTTGQPMSVVASWMTSPQHRANILDGRFVAVGVALAQGTWEGVPATYVVAVFGDVR